MGDILKNLLCSVLLVLVALLLADVVLWAATEVSDFIQGFNNG